MTSIGFLVIAAAAGILVGVVRSRSDRAPDFTPSATAFAGPRRRGQRAPGAGASRFVREAEGRAA